MKAQWKRSLVETIPNAPKRSAKAPKPNHFAEVLKSSFKGCGPMEYIQKTSNIISKLGSNTRESVAPLEGVKVVPYLELVPFVPGHHQSFAHSLAWECAFDGWSIVMSVDLDLGEGRRVLIAREQVGMLLQKHLIEGCLPKLLGLKEADEYSDDTEPERLEEIEGTDLRVMSFLDPTRVGLLLAMVAGSVSRSIQLIVSMRIGKIIAAGSLSSMNDVTKYLVNVGVWSKTPSAVAQENLISDLMKHGRAGPLCRNTLIREFRDQRSPGRSGFIETPCVNSRMNVVREPHRGVGIQDEVTAQSVADPSAALFHGICTQLETQNNLNTFYQQTSADGVDQSRGLWSRREPLGVNVTESGGVWNSWKVKLFDMDYSLVRCVVEGCKEQPYWPDLGSVLSDASAQLNVVADTSSIAPKRRPRVYVEVRAGNVSSVIELNSSVIGNIAPRDKGMFVGNKPFNISYVVDHWGILDASLQTLLEDAFGVKVTTNGCETMISVDAYEGSNKDLGCVGDIDGVSSLIFGRVQKGSVNKHLYSCSDLISVRSDRSGRVLITSGEGFVSHPYPGRELVAPSGVTTTGVDLYRETFIAVIDADAMDIKSSPDRSLEMSIDVEQFTAVISFPQWTFPSCEGAIDNRWSGKKLTPIRRRKGIGQVTALSASAMFMNVSGGRWGPKLVANKPVEMQDIMSPSSTASLLHQHQQKLIRSIGAISPQLMTSKSLAWNVGSPAQGKSRPSRQSSQQIRRSHISNPNLPAFADEFWVYPNGDHESESSITKILKSRSDNLRDPRTWEMNITKAFGLDSKPSLKDAVRFTSMVADFKEWLVDQEGCGLTHERSPEDLVELGGVLHATFEFDSIYEMNQAFASRSQAFRDNLKTIVDKGFSLTSVTSLMSLDDRFCFSSYEDPDRVRVVVRIKGLDPSLSMSSTVVVPDVFQATSDSDLFSRLVLCEARAWVARERVPKVEGSFGTRQASNETEKIIRRHNDALSESILLCPGMPESSKAEGGTHLVLRRIAQAMSLLTFLAIKADLLTR